MQNERIVRSLRFAIIALLLASCASIEADPVTTLGSPQRIFATGFGDGSGISYPCGFIPRTRSPFQQDNEPYFDGPIAPISYTENGVTKIRFNASLGSQNYRLTSTLQTNGSFSGATLDCQPVYTPALSTDPNSFDWAQWLYGTFRDTGTGKVYAVLYNEFYGGHYPRGSHSNMSVLGLAVSYDNGASFQKSVSDPNNPSAHIIIRPNYLWSEGGGGGNGYQGGIFKSPLDGMYYVSANGDLPLLAGMLRGTNLDDPSTWRGWDGTGFNLATNPLVSSLANIDVAPFYLGYSDYFKKYISVTTGNVNGEPARGSYQIVYKLSEDLVHWGPYRKVMDNPACPSTGTCASISSYPSAMDPVYLRQTSDSVTASNGIIGAHPYITYVQNFGSGALRQDVSAQQVSFDRVPTNRIDNFSVRGSLEQDKM